MYYLGLQNTITGTSLLLFFLVMLQVFIGLIDEANLRSYGYKREQQSQVLGSHYDVAIQCFDFRKN